MQIHAEIVVSGLVQGVGFRYYTQRKANEYRLNGYVKNQADGSVLCEVEGEEGLVRDFTRELKIGPSFSRVSSADVNFSQNIYGYKTFEVRY